MYSALIVLQAKYFGKPWLARKAAIIRVPVAHHAFQMARFMHLVNLATSSVLMQPMVKKFGEKTSTRILAENQAGGTIPNHHSSMVATLFVPPVAKIILLSH